MKGFLPARGSNPGTSASQPLSLTTMPRNHSFRFDMSLLKIWTVQFETLNCQISNFQTGEKTGHCNSASFLAKSGIQ